MLVYPPPPSAPRQAPSAASRSRTPPPSLDRRRGAGVRRGTLIADQFWYGPVWEIGLRRHREQVLRHGIELRLLPLAEHAPVYLSPDSRPACYPDGQVLDLRAISLAPQVRVRVPKPAGC